MSSRLHRLLASYDKLISVPWQGGLAGIQKVMFAVYDKGDELKLRASITEFEISTQGAGHGWEQIDITDAFPSWMAEQEYREGYFEYPDDLDTALPEFVNQLVEGLTEKLKAFDENTVVALLGVGSLFGFAKSSEVIGKIAPHIQGRLLVFFPGEYENNNYRLLDARDGWNYQAVPITASDHL
jgi:hypothetical protein